MRPSTHVLALASLLAACTALACSAPSRDTTGDGGSPTTETGGGAGDGEGGSGAGPNETGGAGGTGTAGGNGGAGDGGAGGGGGTGGTDAAWGPDQCPSPPDGVTVGIEVGQQLPDLTVTDCDGNKYSLNNLCGAKGLWLFAAHGWCPLCKNVSQNAEVIHDAFAPQGLATALVVVETGSSQKPDADYCKLWRDQFGLEDVLTLHDPTGAILDVWPGSSSSLSAFIDADRVIRSKLYHDGDIATIKSHIEMTLADM